MSDFEMVCLALLFAIWIAVIGVGMELAAFRRDYRMRRRGR